MKNVYLVKGDQHYDLERPGVLARLVADLAQEQALLKQQLETLKSQVAQVERRLNQGSRPWLTKTSSK